MRSLSRRSLLTITQAKADGPLVQFLLSHVLTTIETRAYLATWIREFARDFRWLDSCGLRSDMHGTSEARRRDEDAQPPTKSRAMRSRPTVHPARR